MRDGTHEAPTRAVIVAVAVEAPLHAAMAPTLSYRAETALPSGTLVRVPLGKRQVTGIVFAGVAAAPTNEPLRAIDEVLDAVPPLPPGWCDLVVFASTYYLRTAGEMALSVLPAALRQLDRSGLADRVKRLHKRRPGAPGKAIEKALPARSAELLPTPDPAQEAALRAIDAARRRTVPGVVLLHGVTGSGKTEVYLRAAAAVLDAAGQALVLVPEINLTPQLIERFAARFGPGRIAVLHSGLTPAARLRNWLSAQLGLADLVLGTRLALFAPLPRIALVVVDEEHDPSYKQQEGARYSARDLAVWRGRREGALVILGSATPSLESWQHAEQGRYERVQLPGRIGGAAWPVVKTIDLRRLQRPPSLGGPSAPPALAPELLAAIERRLGSGEQSLVFLNRRGYAPVLQCGECGWLSGCPHCSAWRVFHKLDRTLRCHHCGLADRVPRACPECGNLDIAAVGRGTERLEEQLAALLPGARIARIDADSTRKKGALEARLQAVHAGEVDVLVGTQMIAKGHDFRRIGLVAAVNPDATLFSADFRGPERLFALLMQAAGRAGRDAASAGPSEMWIQTAHPGHPLYQALAKHDYPAFAAGQLKERESAGLPPFSHLALLRADAATAETARAFLAGAAGAGRALAESDGVMIYAPVPLTVARVADVERMQMLVEAASRPRLQAFLHAWWPRLDAVRRQGSGAPRILRWAIDIDPLTI